MSYILEALKKAQAERQLGSTPGIHDVLAPSAPTAASSSTVRYRIGGVALVVFAAFLGWRMIDPVPPAAPVQLAKAGPAVVAPAPVVKAAVAPAKPAPAVKAPVIEPPAPQPAVIEPPVQAPVQAAPVPDADEALPMLAELPPSVQGTIPRITLGGYIYSPVPAERLLLIDNNLRREGEEVAAGLVLERLLPRAAVMNYRGTRYKVPY